MLDAAREAIEHARGMSREDLEGNRLVQLALVKLIENVGEAASRISPTYQAENPSIPWPQIVGMRNRLVHGYDEIDVGMLHVTVSQDLPDLVRTLENMV